MGLVGHTPLVKIQRLCPDGAPILAKLEGLNPGGSVKDRLVMGLLERLQHQGILSSGTAVVEASSGNLGISLAMCGAGFGLDVTVVMPEGVSADHRRLVAGFGAKVLMSAKEQGMDGAVAAAETARRQSGAVGLAPFSNSDGPEVMAASLGRELAEELGEAPQVVVAGVGTGATLMGLTYLQRSWPDIQMVAVEPSESAVLAGGRPGVHHIPGLGAGFVPAIFDRTKVDEVLTVPTEEALAMARRAAQEEGILCGPSGGAALAAAIRMARRPSVVRAGRPVVTVLPDGGERYLLTPGFVQAPPPRTV